jgi:O-methyltransferase
MTDIQLISLLSKTIGMQDFSSAINLCALLMQCRDVPGDVVELGCNRGDTAKLLAAITDKRVVVFDSFEGLPEPSYADQGCNEGVRKGAMLANIHDLVRNFEQDGIPRPEIFNGWFNEVSVFQVSRQIAFAHIDADLFESTMDALMLVYSNLSRGAVCVIHDYNWPGTPGVKKAVDEFLLNKAEKAVMLPTVHGVMSQQAYFRKI